MEMDKVIVSTRAIEARIRRKIDAEGLRLMKPRADSKAAAHGPYLLIRGVSVEASGCTLESLAERFGLLEPYEQIESNGD